jgi:hypothetical protein
VLEVVVLVGDGVGQGGHRGVQAGGEDRHHPLLGFEHRDLIVARPRPRVDGGHHRSEGREGTQPFQPGWHPTGGFVGHAGVGDDVGVIRVIPCVVPHMLGDPLIEVPRRFGSCPIRYIEHTFDSMPKGCDNKRANGPLGTSKKATNAAFVLTRGSPGSHATMA